MIRTNLRYHRPDTPEQVSELLGEHGEAAAVLGGGTWLLPLMHRGERTHDHVVDLKGLGLEPIAAADGGFTLAATATYEDVLAHAQLCEAVPLLALMAGGVTGGRQLRNQATLAGWPATRTLRPRSPRCSWRSARRFGCTGQPKRATSPPRRSSSAPSAPR